MAKKKFEFLSREWFDNSAADGRRAELHFDVPARMEDEVDQTPCVELAELDGNLRIVYQPCLEEAGDDVEFYRGPEKPLNLIRSAEAARKVIAAIAAIDQDRDARTMVHLWLKDCYPGGSILGLPLK